MTDNPPFGRYTEHDARYAYLREYYGKHLEKTGDLQVTACCTDLTSARFSDTLALLPDEVVQRQYGCGSPLPDDDLTGCTVVDFGCGAGTDAFLASRLVGPTGRVIGLDITDEQLDVARAHAPAVMAAFGYGTSNVAFHNDFIEHAAKIETETVDLVISNCVINLSPRKDMVFRTIHRILRPGGELYLADIVCDRRLPQEARQLDARYSECLTGAEYEADLLGLMEGAGFSDVRFVSRLPLEDRVPGQAARFTSVTMRAFKLPLDRGCEDYGQTATYLGTVAGYESAWRLDQAHGFELNRPTLVCRNTARMLSDTRLSAHFEVTEERQHFGSFDCGPAPQAASGEPCC